MSIKDCFGQVAVVGDTIAYSQGSAGAKPWDFGTITKITEKCVYFKGLCGTSRRHNWKEESDLRRGEGCFVINLEERDK